VRKQQKSVARSDSARSLRVNGETPSADLDALLAALTPEQQALFAAKINARTGPGTGPKKNRRDPLGSRRPEVLGF